MKVVLSVGTHEQPFDRMVAVADTLASAGHDVTIQYGYSAAPSVAHGFDFASSDTLTELVGAADVVVSHGGPATVLQALDAGRLPVVFPRLHRFAEHVDDHQLAFSRHLQRQGLARVAETENEVVKLVLEGARAPDSLAERKARVAANRLRVAESLDAWLSSRSGG